PGDLERQIDAFVVHYNHVRYHESIDNLTPADFASAGCRRISSATIDKSPSGSGHARDHKDIPPVLAEIGKLTPIFGRLESMGMTANLVVRSRTTQDVSRRSMSRIYQIQRVEFVPSVHVSVQTSVFSIVAMMMFSKT
ncbi:hypothetical protein OY671_009716, partial [Metschnikowia pulcherrima]